MATRVRIDIDTRRVAEMPGRFRQWIEHLRRLGPRLLLWRALWFPFWFGGDLPAPWLPDDRREDDLPPSPAARGAMRAIDDIGRRAWWNMAIASIVRGLWLPFVVGSIVILVQYLRHEPFTLQSVAWLWAVTLPLALAYAWTQRPNRARTAAMLDRTFGLHDRLTTALEGETVPFDTRLDRSHLPYLQLADAANVASGLKTDPRFRIRLPARELSLAILAGLMMLALLFLRGVGGDLPVAADTAVPRFVPAAERRTAAAGQMASEITVRPPTVAEVEAASERSASATEDLNAVADALEANALTQPAADAIRAGNYAAAGQSLRDNATQAANLPPESREELASALDQAAAATQGSSPALSNAASDAAEGLRQGGDDAVSSMQDLGDAVELAGESVVSNDVLAAQMQQAQQAAASGADQGADAAQSQSSGSAGPSNPQAGQAGEPGDPIEGGSGSGADAAAGSASDSSGSPSGSNDGSDMVDAAAGADNSGASDIQSGLDGGQSGDQSGTDGANASQPGGQPGEDPASIGGESPGLTSELASEQGAGASGGSAQPSQDSESGDAGAGQATGETSSGEAPVEPNMSDAAVQTGAGTAPTANSDQSIGLSDSGGGDAFQLGGGGSASSLGSGAGVMVAGGNGTQEAVADAGPESNRTPAEYRPIVENYFARD